MAFLATDRLACGFPQKSLFFRARRYATSLSRIATGGIRAT